jgi:predicted amidohydrolase YtcJ
LNPEKIFINGNIITVDAQRPHAQAFSVSGGKFLAVGSNEEITALKGDYTEIIDLQGQTVVPGFNDSHMHLLSVGAASETVNLVPALSVADMISISREFLASNPHVPWLLGRGWSHEKFADKRLPSRHDLDQISTDIPVFFSRVCGHVSVSNSRALDMAGVVKGLEQPVGGHIDFDEQGEPTGILRERASGLVARHIPESGLKDYKRMFLKGAKEAIGYGLTSVQSDDLGDLGAAELKLQALKELVEEGKLPLRMNLQIRLSTPQLIDQWLSLKERFVFPEHTVDYGPMKLMCDGSLGGRTAAMNEPYSDDPSTCGVAILTQEEISHMLLHAHAKGMQVCGHAIGDRTMDMMLDGFRNMLAEYPKEDARPRIIHAQLTNERILQNCKELGVICDIQPIFTSTDLHFVETRVGKKRASLTYAWKTMRDMGIGTAGGSDAPVESCNPILGLYAAVTRQDEKGYPEGGWLPEQKLSIDEALQLFTVDSAFASFDEYVKGSIKSGMLADFVVLSDDVKRISPEKIKDLTVTATYIGGVEPF